MELLWSVPLTGLPRHVHVKVATGLPPPISQVKVTGVPVSYCNPRGLANRAKEPDGASDTDL